MDLNKLPKIEIDNPQAFLFGLPELVKKEWLVSIETIFHFDIPGEKGGQFSVQVKECQMSVFKGFIGQPNCVIQTKDKHFIQLAKGELNPVMALLTGKLKVSNKEEIMKYAHLFGLI